MLGQYNYNLDYLSLFVKFMFIFILFDVVLIALLKVFRENNVSIFSHSLHTCLLANCIDISSGYSVWPGIRFKYKSCIERKIWVNCYYLALSNTNTYLATKSSRSTSSLKFIFDVIVENMRRFWRRSGRGNSIFLSERSNKF